MCENSGGPQGGRTVDPKIPEIAKLTVRQKFTAEDWEMLPSTARTTESIRR